MPRYKKVKDHADLVRDSVGNAVLNSNNEAFLEFRNRKDKEAAVQNKLQELENKMDSIHGMLEQLLQNKL